MTKKLSDQLKIEEANSQLANKISKQFGCVTKSDLELLIEIDRLMLVLVRTMTGRFLVPIQDAENFINRLISKRADVIRDVSIPGWRKEENNGQETE